ncbi:MAG: hypothetical protein WBB28_01300 [Crinalium sp.]
MNRYVKLSEGFHFNGYGDEIQFMMLDVPTLLNKSETAEQFIALASTHEDLDIRQVGLAFSDEIKTFFPQVKKHRTYIYKKLFFLAKDSFFDIVSSVYYKQSEKKNDQDFWICTHVLT